MTWTMILFLVTYAGGVVGGILVGMNLREGIDAWKSR